MTDDIREDLMKQLLKPLEMKEVAESEGKNDVLSSIKKEIEEFAGSVEDATKELENFVEEMTKNFEKQLEQTKENLKKEKLSDKEARKVTEEMFQSVGSMMERMNDYVEKQVKKMGATAIPSSIMEKMAQSKRKASESILGMEIIKAQSKIESNLESAYEAGIKDAQSYNKAFAATMSHGLSTVATMLLGGTDLYGELVKGFPDAVLLYRKEINEAIFTTQGLTKETQMLREQYMKVSDIVETVGYDVKTVHGAMLILTKRGIKSAAQMKTISKSSMATAKMMGLTASESLEIVNLFADWNQQLQLSESSLESIGFGMRDISRTSGLTGQNLVNAVKSSQNFLEALKKSGQLSSASAKNVMQMVTSLQKAGVLNQANSILELLTDPSKFYTGEAGPLGTMMMASANQSGNTDNLLSGTVTKSQEDQLKFFEKFDENVLNIVRGFGLKSFKKEDVEALDPGQKALANAALARLGFSVDEFSIILDQMYKASKPLIKTFEDYDSEIAKNKELLKTATDAGYKALLEEKIKAAESGKKIALESRVAATVPDLNDIVSGGGNFLNNIKFKMESGELKDSTSDLIFAMEEMGRKDLADQIKANDPTAMLKAAAIANAKILKEKTGKDLGPQILSALQSNNPEIISAELSQISYLLEEANTKEKADLTAIERLIQKFNVINAKIIDWFAAPMEKFLDAIGAEGLFLIYTGLMAVAGALSLFAAKNSLGFFGLNKLSGKIDDVFINLFQSFSKNSISELFTKSSNFIKDSFTKLPTFLDDVYFSLKNFKGFNPFKGFAFNFFDTINFLRDGISKLAIGIESIATTYFGFIKQIFSGIISKLSEIGPAFNKIRSIFSLENIKKVFSFGNIKKVGSGAAGLARGAAGLARGAAGLLVPGRVISTAAIFGGKAGVKLGLGTSTLGVATAIFAAIEGAMGAWDGYTKTTKIFTEVLKDADEGMEEATTGMYVASTLGGFLAGALDSISFGLLGLIGVKEPLQKIFSWIYYAMIMPFEKIWEGIKSGFSDAWKDMQPLLNEAWKAFDQIGVIFSDTFSSIGKMFGIDIDSDSLTGIFEFFTKGLNLAGRWFKSLGYVLGYSIVGIIKLIIPWIKLFAEVITDVVYIISGVIKFISGIVGVVWNSLVGLYGLFTGDWDVANQALDNIIESMKGILSGLGEVIWGALKGLFDITLGLLVAFVSSIFQSILDAFGVDFNIFDTVYNGIKEIKKWFDWLFDCLVGHSIIPDMIMSIIQWFATLPLKILNILLQVPKMIAKAFSGIFKSIFKSLGFQGGIPEPKLMEDTNLSSSLINAQEQVERIKTARSSVNSAPLTDAYEMALRENTSGETESRHSVKDMTKILSINEEQLNYLMMVHEDMQELIDLIKPKKSGNSGARSVSTVSNIQPPGSTNYNKWQFGRASQNYNRAGITDGQ